MQPQTRGKGKCPVAFPHFRKRGVAVELIPVLETLSMDTPCTAVHLKCRAGLEGATSSRSEIKDPANTFEVLQMNPQFPDVLLPIAFS